MSSQRQAVRTIRHKTLALALHNAMAGASQLQWPYFLAAHMVKLVNEPQKDANGRLVMVTRAV